MFVPSHLDGKKVEDFEFKDIKEDVNFQNLGFILR